ncbi:hypothetical protein BaRGS_00030904 [Batillaria attramentaria]|uniref:Uncharacterized protein n=1 Tax=Batillaria attramentaria TaxID=370345 RepID=A0ABD0JSS4_9CAEN
MTAVRRRESGPEMGIARLSVQQTISGMLLSPCHQIAFRRVIGLVTLGGQDGRLGHRVEPSQTLWDHLRSAGDTTFW